MGWHSAALILVSFAVFALVAYRGALTGPFISDDVALIRDNPFLRSLDLDGLAALLDPTGEARHAFVGHYSPVPLLGHALEWHVWGTNTLGYHVVNVLIHALNSTLLVLLLESSGITRRVDGDSPDLFTSLGGGIAWIRAALKGSCGWASGRDDQCLVWDQIANPLSQPADSGTEVAVLHYIAAASGVASFEFEDESGSDFVFFDQADALDTGSAPSGFSATLPEPSTAPQTAAVLIGLVLCLALDRRRRRGDRGTESLPRLGIHSLRPTCDDIFQSLKPSRRLARTRGGG